MNRSRGLLIGSAVVAAVVAIWWLTSTRTEPSEETNTPRSNARVLERAVQPPAPINVARSDQPAAAPPSTPAGESALPTDDEEMRPTLADVDLEEVRKAMPDNSYWKYSAPTRDPQVLQEREAERERWNADYGKVLSGTGTEDEIRAYYDHRARLFGDYNEFASYLLDHHKENLSEQDQGLLNLAVRLNRTRLEEVPRKVEEAFARKHQQDAAREAWLADQANYGGDESDQN